MTQALLQLQAHLKAVLPLLNDNLSAANREWMEGKIARGAYQYCFDRHSSATALAFHDAAAIDENMAFLVGAPLFIDLPVALKDVPADRHAAEQEKVDALRALYVAQGFTAEHSWLKFPMRPDAVGAVIRAVAAG